MQAVQQKKKQKNIELLLLYQKLVDLEESCITKLFRFEKSETFLQFQQRYSVPRVIHLRIDDFIYFLLLALLETIFGLLPMDSDSPLSTPYRQSLALYFITTFSATISPHWFRWLALFSFCLGYPGLIYLTINGYITLMPRDTSISMFSYLGYLSLAPILVLVVAICPLKEFIRNEAGALYSYIYGLSLTLILYLWPLYSLITEISDTGSISFNFIINNQALITAFIVLVVTGFYFFVHHALFEPKLDRVQQLLLESFTGAELQTALEEVAEARVSETSFLFSNFHCFVRSMSLIIYGLTLAIEIFLYRQILEHSSQMLTLGVLMGYQLLFLLFGAAYLYVNIKAVILLPIVGIASLSTAVPSLFYYDQSVDFKVYVYISLSGPFVAIFWSIIKNVSNRALIFRTIAIIGLYLTIFLPVIALLINSFGYFSSDSQVVSTLHYVLLGLIALTILLLLVIFIVWEVKRHQLQQKKEEQVRVPLDYNYFEEGDPEYRHYQVKQDYGMGHLAGIDLREIGYISGLAFFVISELLSLHAVNLLRTQFADTVFYSQDISYIIYSQFGNILLFYMFTHCYMAFTEGSTVRNLFLATFLGVSAATLVLAFRFSGSGVSTTLKLVGGFSIVMVCVLLAVQWIKEAAERIFGFISTLMVLALWLFIVLPYVEVIPFASLFVSQTQFGNFIYGCILGSVILLILMVGILTLVFNRLIDKFQEEKKYKFMMEDVMVLLKEEGVEGQDELLHISAGQKEKIRQDHPIQRKTSYYELEQGSSVTTRSTLSQTEVKQVQRNQSVQSCKHNSLNALILKSDWGQAGLAPQGALPIYESFMFRDKKYVFFLKRGYPLNLLQDPQDHITKLVTSEDYQLKRVPTKKDITEEEQKKRSLLYACLTCCCGEDEEEIGEKLAKAKKVIDREELQLLLPRSVAEGLLKQGELVVQKKKKKKQWKNPASVYSSKSLILKNLHSGPRYLGDEYILLKSNKNADLAIQIWHNIFDFVANSDEGEELIISNDFHILIKVSQMGLSVAEVDELFHECASAGWKSNSGMNLQDFALAVEIMASKEYPGKEEEAKFYLLINSFFYNLALYQEFNSFLVEKKTKNRLSKSQLKTSPFQRSYLRFGKYREEKRQREEGFMKRVNKLSSNKEIPLQKIQEREVHIEQEVEEEKKVSCKKMMFEKVRTLDECCKKEKEVEDFERKLFVRPWSLICIDALQIMEKKESEWEQVQEAKEHPFRCTSNNLIMAAVKFIDIFTYVSVSILNPQIGWIEGLESSNLYLSYKVQVYLAVAVVAVSVPFGIRGIMLIFEDRLGLTQNRLPASFPHPMFFFTLFYKLMILSLFNMVSQTFLTTFNCNWTSDTQPYTLKDDPSVECFSSGHNTMVIISLACLIGYYPLSSYAMPNFQFAEKSLDLKYRPSYLILYFQVNFILLACKVLLSGSTSQNIQIINSSIIIAVLLYLGFSVGMLKPCFVLWFNWVQLGTILIGVTVNTVGLALLLTRQWSICVIVASSLCGGIIILILVVIKKGYFSGKVSAEQQVNEEQYKQLELMWNSKQKKDKFLINFEDNSRHKGVPLKEDSSEEGKTQGNVRQK